ncbi:hypothetical protein [Streptomyces sp. NPDC048309]|uniref:hypothetical protein n=1 Tax=Streptomyces sp. NPDC048309 TaxID=3154618 RepID=UPI0033FF43A2
MRSARSVKPFVVKPFVVLGLVAVAATACGAGTTPGGGKVRDSGRGADQGRARQVAAAWEGSEAARVWQEGYHPLGDPVQLPEGAFHADADKRAYLTQNFELRGSLPDAPQKKARIRWPGGDSLALPLTSARAAYEQLDRGGNAGPALTVTGGRLGDMTLLTSRGPAKVPAWHFTVEGYDTPLKRVAVAPSKLPAPPVKAVSRQTDELGPLAGPAAVADDNRTVTLRAGHGSCDDGSAVDVLETGGSVVFSASIRGVSDGPCTADLRIEKVTVKLDRPVGDRMLLDAFTGRPVPYEQPGSASPSRS